MPIDVNAATTIRRLRADVAEVMFDPILQPRWTSTVLETGPLDGPARQGAHFARVTHRFGRRRREVVEILDHMPNQRLELAVQQPFAMHIAYELQPIPEGTIARIRAHGRVSGPLRLFRPMLRAILRRSIRRDLDALKSLVESRSAADRLRAASRNIPTAIDKQIGPVDVGPGIRAKE